MDLLKDTFTFRSEFASCKVLRDNFDCYTYCQTIELIVQSDNKTFIVWIKRFEGEEYFSVQSVINSSRNRTFWHCLMEPLEGTPVLVQVRGNFFIAIIDEKNFPEVTRVIPFTSWYSAEYIKTHNSLTQLELKQRVSELFLIGWRLSKKERRQPEIRKKEPAEIHRIDQHKTLYKAAASI